MDRFHPQVYVAPVSNGALELHPVLDAPDDTLVPSHHWLLTRARASPMVDNLTPGIASFPFPYATFLWVWGANSEGELGNFGNVTVDINHPVLNDVFFPAGTQLTGLAAGDENPQVFDGSHSLAVASSGNLFAWGHDVYGQVGDGHAGTDVLGPVQVCAGGQTAPCTQFLSGIIAAAAGRFHSLALDGVGNVWAWGNNEVGQLGVNSGIFSFIPSRNDALFAEVNQHGRPPVRAIAAGDSHSLALDSGSNIWAWGWNTSGQLGIGSNEPSVTFASPILSLRGMGIKAIAAGGEQSFALDSENNVWAWGLNDRGQLGISSSNPLRNVPVKLDHFPQLNTRIIRIAAGARHTLAIDNHGAVWAWGANDQGQLGIGITSDSRAPIRVHFPAGTPRIVLIAAGGLHSVAVDANGNLWAWGSNVRGQLGIGTVTASHVPILVNFPAGTAHTIVSIAAGARHSLALASQSFLFGLEAVMVFDPLKDRVLLLPQSLTRDVITVTATSSAIDPAGQKLLVTNTLTDTAGNKLVLTLIEQRDDHKSLVLEVQSVQYNDGAVITPPQNRIAYSWDMDATGTVTSLKQHLELDRGAGKTEITAQYDSVKKQTVIDVVHPTKAAKLTAPGMVSFRTGTISGHLGFSDGSRMWPH